MSTALDTVDERVTAMRDNSRSRRFSLAVAVVVGLGLVAVHWVGLFVAGALVGLTRRTLPRAVVAGFVFGVVVLAAFFVVTPLVGPGNVSGLAPLSYVTIGIALLGPTWGALVRGVV